MNVERRAFLANAGSALATLCTSSAAGGTVHSIENSEDEMGVLVDMTQCIGCRLCEYACKKANGIEPGALDSYDDQSVFATMRRPTTDALTVINAWPLAANPSAANLSASMPTTESTQPAADAPVFAKVNCLHCRHPACVSACIVGALQKQPDGPVTYDAWKCIGCRYCMVACPFQIPAYEFAEVLTPRVRKCDMCAPRLAKNDPPACVAECPRQAMTFGRRSALLDLAHERIAAKPGEYVDHVYGEHEVGGTSWIYLANVPFEQAGFQKLGTKAPPALTEAIQHGVFKHWIAPIGWYGVLAMSYWLTGRKSKSPGNVEESTGRAPNNNVERQSHHDAQPVARQLLTPGVWALIVIVLVGLGFGLYRFIFGLAASTNLNDQYPWGLWIAMDVGSGIALAGGGFVTAAVVHIFHREKYHAVARSALLTALLGYTFYVPGLLADIGRWYNIWHPVVPSMWQVNSVLFEVGICVMLYLNVQYAELAAVVLEQFNSGDRRRFPRLHRLLHHVHVALERAMPAILILGVALSTFHQSSLGNLMVITPYKLHPLWWTPWSPLLFLLSAMMVGFPMVIFTMLFASWSLKRKPEMHVLAPLARYIPVFLSVYLFVKVADLVWRGAYRELGTITVQSVAWTLEMLIGVIIPLVMLLRPAVRNSRRWLGIACLAVIFGVVLNRLNVFIIGYRPPFAQEVYFPSITEFAVSAGLVAALLLVYRIAVTYLPILDRQPTVTQEKALEHPRAVVCSEEAVVM